MDQLFWATRRGAGPVVVLMILGGALLIGMGVLILVRDRPASVSGRSVSLASILSAPETYEGKEVLLQGKVVAARQATFPNGRRYYTLSIGDERVFVTVFSWERPLVNPGDSVRVEGTFHTWRYNIHHMIENARTHRDSDRSRVRQSPRSVPASTRARNEGGIGYGDGPNSRGS